MFRWADHTGELELAIEAPTEHAVYEDAVRALAELLGDDEDGADAAADAAPWVPTIELVVEAPDRPRLLAELLAELAFLAEIEGFVPIALERIQAHQDGLRAVVRGRAGAPPHLVKAVTYHRLAFERAPAGWRANVVLDV